MSFDSFKNKYEIQEKELLVLLHEGGGGSKHGDFWVASAYFLAYIDTQTNTLCKGEGRLVWPVTDEEQKAGGCFGRFKNETIYRVKARALLDKTVKPGMSESFFNQFYVTEILEKNVCNPLLEELLEEYKRPVVIKDDLLGELKLNKQLSFFEGQANWQSRSISISLDVDKDCEKSWENALNAAKQIIAEQDNWDKKMRDFAAKELTSLANDWQEDDDDAEITMQDFAKRIKLMTLSVAADGSFAAYHNDDEMFWGHSVTVYGSLEHGIKSAQMEG